VRLRKQAKAGPLPGDEFLRAVSSGRGNPRPAAPVLPTGDPALRQQVLETERRATAAEEALRQIREESQLRLDEARSALERERDARIAAERELELARGAPPEPQARPEAPAPAQPQPAEAEPRTHAVPDHGDAPGFQGEHHEPPADLDHLTSDDEEAPEWPTPWLGPDGRGRGLFRRSSP
jgi:hypothetical protein